MAKYSKNVCLDIKTIIHNSKKSDFEKCEDIFRLLKGGFVGKELMDQYPQEYHVILGVMNQFKILNAPWLSVRCLDRFIKSGRLHTMTDNLIKVTLGIEVIGLSDAIKVSIRECKIRHQTTFIENATQKFKETTFDYSHGFYHDDDTPMLMICKSCETQYLQTPKKHLGTLTPCFQCVLYSKGQSGVDTEEDLSVHWSKIMPNFYIGDIYSVTDAPFMITKRIKAVVDLSNAAQPFKTSSNIKMYKVNIDDVSTSNIRPYFKPSFDFIDEFIDRNEAVLVFCRAGVSRSATIVIYYLMKKYNLSYEDCLKFVKSKRKQIQPNDGFVEQLLEV
jgi:hypothetical protein